MPGINYLVEQMLKLQSPLAIFASAPIPVITISATATTQSLNDVVISGIPSGVTIARVTGGIFWGETIDDSGSANKLLDNQNLQVRKSVGGTWTTFLTLPDDCIHIGASLEGSGRLFPGYTDVKAEVTGNGTYNIQWVNSRADASNILLKDVVVYLQVTYQLT